MLNTRGIKTRKGSATRRTPVAVGVVISVCLAISVLLVARGAASAAGASSFDAVGSAEQVYVTGLAPDAQASLISSGGTILYTQSADSLGGLLFQDVPPGSGYRVAPDLRRRKIGTAHGAHGRGGAMGSEYL